MKYTVKYLQDKAYEYRMRFLELFTTIGFGHVTSAFSWAEIATVLYNEVMDLPNGIEDVIEHDRLVVSKGHGVGIVFPILEDLGYFKNNELNEIVQIGGSSERIRKFVLPGFDFYGGSLGLGLGLAAGLAKAYKQSEKTNKVFCILGDAETYEGSIWEAAAFAGHQKLDNLIVVIDKNGLGCSDFTNRLINLEPMEKKWEAFNWRVTVVNDGHDINELFSTLMNAKNSKDKPTCIIANTKKGKGLDYLVDKPLMHGYMPRGDDIEKAYNSLKR